MNELAVTRSEWLKFRSVRSSYVGVALVILLTIGLGAMISLIYRFQWHTLTQTTQLAFDPVSTSLAGVIFAQFAVGVVGALFITSEYASGSIRTTLAAVPRRLELVGAKLTVLVITMIVVTEVVCVAAFLTGQAIFAGAVPSATLASSTNLRAVLFGGLYLTLLTILGFALGLILRQSAAAISVFTSLVLVVPLIILFLPQSWRDAAQKFEPSELGHAMTAVVPIPDDFGAVSSLALLATYVALALALGVTTLLRRDA